MADLKTQVREIATVIESKKADAAAAWSSFDALRKSAQSEGVDFVKNEDAFSKLDAASKAYDEIRDEVQSLESKRARLLEIVATDGAKPEERKAAGEMLAKTLGERFTQSDVYAQLKSSGLLDIEASPINTPGVKVATGAEVKTLFTTSAGGAALFRNDRIDRLELSPQPAITVLDVIPSYTTMSDTVEWVREYSNSWTDGFTNNAAETAEGSASTDSALVYSTTTSSVKEIVNWIPVTKKMLQDSDQLEGLINQRILYGIQKRLQAQVIAGDGTGQNLTGMNSTTGIRTQALGTDSRSDAIHKVMTSIRVNAEYDGGPEYLLIHPTDYEKIRLEKTTSGDYYFGGPASVGLFGGTIWGLTPIVTTSVSSGSCFVFAPQSCGLFYHTSGLQMSASDSHSTYFTERKVAMLASLRAAFAVFQPNGIGKVTGI